jgi:hypothetical protein
LPPGQWRYPSDNWLTRRRLHIPQVVWFVGLLALAAGAIGVAVRSNGDDRSTGAAGETIAGDVTVQPNATATSGATSDSNVVLDSTGSSVGPGAVATSSNASTTLPTSTTTTLAGATPGTTQATVPPTVAPTTPTVASEAPVAPGTGSADSPVPIGKVADIGGGWRLQVVNVVPDATAAVVAANGSVVLPPDGSRFTLVTIALGYFGMEDPKTAFDTTIAAIGVANADLSNQCGPVPGALNPFGEVFSGGVTTGNICFVTTAQDFPALALYATGGLLNGSQQVFFSAGTTPPAVTPMAPLPGPQPGAAATPARLSPTPKGIGADIGGGWALTVNSSPTDITAAVIAESELNVPPPDGSLYLGINVTYAYLGTGSASAFAVIANAVGGANVAWPNYCGVIPNQIDSTQVVSTGGTVAGTLCFVVPAADRDLLLYATADLSVRDVMFATR